MKDRPSRIRDEASAEELRALAGELEAQLAAAHEARERLLHGAAHDLRNPLNTFSMSVGLLKDDLERDDLDPSRIATLLQRMERSTGKMHRLLDDLLETSRIEAGAIVFAPRSESAKVIIDRAVTKAMEQSADRQVAIVAGAADPAIRCWSDPDRTAQALVKLVAFVLRAVGDGGTITLDAAAGDDATTTLRIRAVGASGSPSNQTGDAARAGISFVLGRGLVESQDGTVALDDGGIAVTLPTKTTG